MKEYNEMPTSGQFVAVWEYEGKIWSNTYLYNDGELRIYSEERNNFIYLTAYNRFPTDEQTNVRYFTID